jgi:UDP-2,4-diacetamido-2,4,6-trideoxy-beta-L-altropyranose hydrolase
MIGQIEGRGYTVLRLDAPVALPVSSDGGYGEAWLGTAWQADAAEVLVILGLLPRQDWLIVDNYALDIGWEQQIRPGVGRIMVIDDLANRHHGADVLLDQNLYDGMASRYDGLIPDTCVKLLGPKYALLRPEFCVEQEILRRHCGIVRRILIFFGGSDPSNETTKALEAIGMLNRPDIAVDVVVGGGNPRRHELERLCRRYPGVTFYCQVDNMAELMSAADLAIGAGGTATWERCALGLPALVIALADNQVELAETAARRGMVFFLGSSGMVSSARIREALDLFIGAPENLSAITATSLAMVDAKGAQRVAIVLDPPSVAVRRAVLDDCDAIHAWRNSEETRRYIFEAAPIPLETHRRWFCATLENPQRILLIGEIDSRPVGVIRYDIEGCEALVSVYLVPGGQGQGIGTELIRCGSQWLREHCTNVTVIRAEIFRENVASLRAFEQAGFSEHHATYQEVIR